MGLPRLSEPETHYKERCQAMQTWTSNRKPDGKALVTWLFDVRGSREMQKNLNLKVSTDKDYFNITVTKARFDGMYFI